MYKLVLLDADRTIFDFDRAEIHSIKTALHTYQVNDNLDEIIERYKVINMKLWKQYEKNEIDKKIIPAERFRRLFSEYNLIIDPVDFGKEYLKNLSSSGFIIDQALELCQYLYKKYKLVILTNGIKEVQEQRLANSSLKPYIHDMVVSDEIGIPKPDVRIYEYALNKVGHFDKSDIIMIGDSLSSDIQGGINFNIDTCWYNSDETIKDEAIRPTYTIRDLKELYKIL